MPASKVRIFVVNDYPDFLEMVSELLSDEGYEVVTTPKHRDAFVQLKELQPDLLICDLIFDGTAEGWNLVDKAVLDPSTTNIPILICSAATKQLQEAAGSLNAKGILWLEKPFTLDQLTEQVELALKRRPRSSPPSST
ncbi:MAG: response regulator [Oscillochloris sp.]|nr:response regulator [Oscillochloris sp.]